MTVERRSSDLTGNALLWLAAHPSCEETSHQRAGLSILPTVVIHGRAIRRFDNFAMKSWLRDEPGCRSSVENGRHNGAAGERWRAKRRRRWPILVSSLIGWHRWGDLCQHQLINGAFVPANLGYTDRPGRRDPSSLSMMRTALCGCCAIAMRNIGAPLDSVDGRTDFSTDLTPATRFVSVWSPRQFSMACSAFYNPSISLSADHSSVAAL